jgi:hypothetical protein
MKGKNADWNFIDKFIKLGKIEKKQPTDYICCLFGLLVYLFSAVPQHVVCGWIIHSKPVY